MQQLLLAFLGTVGSSGGVPQDGVGAAAFLGYIGILPQKSRFVGQSVDEHADGVADIFIDRKTYQKLFDGLTLLTEVCVLSDISAVIDHLPCAAIAVGELV